LEIKNAEYHQQTFSDPLMILRMVGVPGFEWGFFLFTSFYVLLQTVVLQVVCGKFLSLSPAVFYSF